MIDRGPLLKTDEVAKLLRVSKGTVLEMVHAGAIPYLKWGPRSFRFPRAAVERWLERQAERNVNPEHAAYDRTLRLVGGR